MCVCVWGDGQSPSGGELEHAIILSTYLCTCMSMYMYVSVVLLLYMCVR